MSITPKFFLPLALVLLAHSAHAVKPCEELANEIAAKLDASGVKDYTLEIVPNDLVAGEKVVGSCNGGTRKIVYIKAKKPATPSPKQP